ncbi:hypothetical protein CDAR_246351 [Caerostris darwini]|uniref:Uncharacterized protein n=1 Tax=Caerostris darwini TaxID=1538125 RepID=A0AAV4W872_9ARAC|nr:hypothetical protein CDAR_246351 [Caerostris darwini]
MPKDSWRGHAILCGSLPFPGFFIYLSPLREKGFSYHIQVIPDRKKEKVVTFWKYDSTDVIFQNGIRPQSDLCPSNPQNQSQRCNFG